MYYLHLGEDPHWSLYHHRERLVFTDPPASAQPGPRHNQARRGAHAVIVALAITAVLHADATTTASTADIHREAKAAPTSRTSCDTDVARSSASRVPDNPTLPNHTKEALR